MRKKGIVKFFSAPKGYGFIIPDDGGEDVFLYQEDINMKGFRALEAREKVSYTEEQNGSKGLKGTNVTAEKGGNSQRYTNRDDYDRQCSIKPSLGSYRRQPTSDTNFPMRLDPRARNKAVPITPIGGASGRLDIF